MLAAVKALVERAGNDGASGIPNRAYLRWAEQGDRARATLAASNPQDRDDAPYILIGLQALAKIAPDEALTRAIAYLSGTATSARSAAAKAIGEFELVTSDARNRAAAALTVASNGANDEDCGHILAAICEIARTHPDMETSAVGLIDSAKEKVGDQTVHQLSFELMLHCEALPTSIVAGLSAIMQKVALENRGTLTNIDATGNRLVTHGRLNEALALITPLITAHDELTSLDLFDGFSSALRQLLPSEFTEILSEWLLSLDGNLGLAANSLVSNNHNDAPLVLEVNGATLGLSDDEKILLAHRAIGYLFNHPITAASLVLGLVRHSGEATRKILIDILFDPLLISYSGELADWLDEQEIDAGDPTQPIIADLLQRLKIYIDGLRNAGRIKELRPSEREVLIESHRQHEAMRQAYKQAEKKSVFLSIATRSVLLYGDRSISYIQRPDGTRERSEMKLQSISHSVEAPRLNTLEPFELDYKLRVFRSMRAAKP